MNPQHQISDFIAGHQSLMTSTLVISTVIILLALILTRFLRNRAAWAHGVQIAALVLVLSTPVLCSLVPQTIKINLTNTNLARSILPSHLNEPKTTKFNSTSKNEYAEKVEATSGPAKSSTKQNSPVAKSQTEPAPFAKENFDFESKKSSAGKPLNWLSFVITTWVSISILLLTRLLFQLYRLKQNSKSFVLSVDPKLTAAFDLAKQHVTGCDDVELIQGNVVGPVAMNWPKPSVAIPDSRVNSLSLDSYRRIFIHELAHIARRDQFVLIFQRSLACLLWPFLPIHFLNRAICRTREDLCDNYIAPNEVVEFCNDLLSLIMMSGSVATNRLSVAPGLLFSKRNLEHRVGSILSPSRCRASQVTMRQFALSGFVILACATTFASVGFDNLTEQHRYVNDFPANEKESEFQPLLQSFRLSKDVPNNVTIEIEDNPNDFQFVQLRYGSSASDRVTVLVVSQPESNEFKLFLDSNRDRIITKEELVKPENPNSNQRVCALESWIQESDECEISKRLTRSVIFKRNILKDRISFATIGYLEGNITLGDQTVLMRRMDANGNGLFLDAEDRVWIDANSDGNFGVEEQFSLSPITIINQQRYRVLADNEKSSFELKPVTSTGNVRLTMSPKDPKAIIKHLRVTFLGDDGSAFTVDGLEPANVPTGTYEISNVSIVVAEPNKQAGQSFVFTRRGQQVSMARSFEIKKDRELKLDPVGELQLASTAYFNPERPEFVRVALQLYTTDGLTVSHSDSGVRGDTIHGMRPTFVKTSATDENNETVSGCESEFY